MQKRQQLIVSDPVILSRDSIHDQSHADHLMDTHHSLNSLTPYCHIVHGGPETVERNASSGELCQVENKRADTEKT